MERILRASEIKAAAKRNLKGNLLMCIAAFIVTSLISSILSAPANAIGSIFESLGEADSDVAAAMTLVLIVPAIIAGVLSILASFVQIILMAGLTKFHLGITEGDKADFVPLFWGFRNHPFRIIGANLLIGLIGFLVCTPFIAAIVILLLCAGLGSGDYEDLSMLILFIAGLLYVALFIVMTIVSLHFALVNALLVDRSEIGAVEALKESSRLMKGFKWRFFCLNLSFIGWYLLIFVTCGLIMFWIVPYLQQSYAVFYKMRVGELDAYGNYVKPAPAPATPVMPRTPEQQQMAQEMAMNAGSAWDEKPAQTNYNTSANNASDGVYNPYSGMYKPTENADEDKND